MNIWIYEYMNINMNMNMNININIVININISLTIYIYIYIYICTCTYTYVRLACVLFVRPFCRIWGWSTLFKLLITHFKGNCWFLQILWKHCNFRLSARRVDASRAQSEIVFLKEIHVLRFHFWKIVKIPIGSNYLLELSE